MHTTQRTQICKMEMMFSRRRFDFRFFSQPFRPHPMADVVYMCFVHCAAQGPAKMFIYVCIDELLFEFISSLFSFALCSEFPFENKNASNRTANKCIQMLQQTEGSKTEHCVLLLLLLLRMGARIFASFDSATRRTTMATAASTSARTINHFLSAIGNCLGAREYRARQI